ncbi:peptidyl-prolyl cis-trans isomerase [Streptomyces pathocidini]|uniref:Peptidyl-prolyl cis-trans isomerase n=1 Tax=Streptomyces pathocidini TaxID=1650571 RepID=A0ABW7UXH9_9ACTN
MSAHTHPHEHTHAHEAPASPLPPGVAASVHGRPLTAALVDERAAATAPAMGRESWPGRDRARRQHRRWVAQVVVAEELVRQACERLDVAPDTVQPLAPAPGSSPDEDYADLGGIASALLLRSRPARALVAYFADRQHIPEADLRTYYERNPDRFLTQEALQEGVDPYSGTPDARHLVPFDRARAGIEARLRRSLAHRAFVSWLDTEREAVVLAPGYEHPGDPAQPDAEHRH